MKMKLTRIESNCDNEFSLGLLYLINTKWQQTVTKIVCFLQPSRSLGDFWNPDVVDLT